MAMLAKIRFAVIVLFLPNNLVSQVLCGTVVDDEHQPIAGASVFVSETTFGTLTDQNGFFVLARLPFRRIKLVATGVGYKRLVKEIVLSEQNAPLILTLESDPVVATELVVHSDNSDWRKNYERFKAAFFGTTQCAKHCTILNPEYLDFNTENGEKTLTATASKPLVIENRALGYKLTYRLSRFQETRLSEYDAEITTTGESFYEPLMPKDIAESARWEETRRRVYFGSQRHFFKSLAKRKAQQEGFSVSEVDGDAYFQGKSNPHIINPDTLINETDASSVKVLRLPKSMEVVYEHASFEPEFRDASFVKRDGFTRSGWTRRRQIISLVEPINHSLLLDTLGNVSNAENALIVYGYWSWKRFADALPMDFNPDTDFVPHIAGAVADNKRAMPTDAMFSPSILIRRGYSRLATKDTLGALTEFSNAITTSPDSSAGYIARGFLRVAQRDYSRANADFTKALMIEPSNAELYFQRGRARLLLGAYPEAEVDFDSTLAMNSTNPYAYYLRGIARSEQRQDSLAIVDFTRALERLPNADAYLKRGMVHRRRGEYEKAMLDFSQAVALDGFYGAAFYERASVAFSMGEKIAGYLDMLKARRYGERRANDFLQRYDGKTSGDTLRFYNTPEIVVEALPLDVEKSVVKMVEITRQQRLSLNIAQTNINVNPDRALRRTVEAINEIGSRLEELAQRTNNEKLLRKLQDFKSLLVKLGNNFTAADTNNSGQAFNEKQRFLADMSLSLMEIQTFIEELQEYLVALNTKSTEKK